MKKMISIMLALVMCIASMSVFSVSAFAADTFWDKAVPVNANEDISIKSYNVDKEEYATMTFVPTESGIYEYEISGFSSKDKDYSVVVFGTTEKVNPAILMNECESLEEIQDKFIAFDLAMSSDDALTSSTYKSFFTPVTAGRTYYIAVAASTSSDPNRVYTMRIKKHTTHIYNAVFTFAASMKKDGETVKKCSICGAEGSSAKIPRIASVKISKTSYTYDGKTHKPAVTIKDRTGAVIPSKYYKVTYSKDCKNAGKYTAKITFKGKYTGTVKKDFVIKPAATSITKISAGRKNFTVSVKKKTTQTSGYQVQYSTSNKFAKNSTKTTTISKNSTTKKTVSNLKGKKKYYVRARTYKTVKFNGKSIKVYSSWSTVKTVKTK